MKLDLYIHSETITTFRAEVARQQAIAEALPALLEEISAIDMQADPSEARKAGNRLYALCAPVLQSTPLNQSSIYLLSQIARIGLYIHEEAEAEQRRQCEREQAQKVQAQRQAEADAKERGEAERIRGLLARHPA